MCSWFNLWPVKLGSGVCYRVMPAALVPRPWDFVDPPMMSKVIRGVTPGPATLAALASSTGEAGKEAEREAFSTEVRDGEAPAEREIEKVESPNEQESGTRLEAATEHIAATTSHHDADPDNKHS
jgi:hypothetical protein